MEFEETSVSVCFYIEHEKPLQIGDKMIISIKKSSKHYGITLIINMHTLQHLMAMSLYLNR